MEDKLTPILNKIKPVSDFYTVYTDNYFDFDDPQTIVNNYFVTSYCQKPGYSIEAYLLVKSVVEEFLICKKTTDSDNYFKFIIRIE